MTTYILTIYFAFTFGIMSVHKLTPDLDACRLEAAKTILELTLPPSITVSARCVELGVEV